MRQQTQDLLEENKNILLKTLKQELVCKRRDKCLYQSDKPDLLVQEFSSCEIGVEQVAGAKKIIDKLRNDISSYLFEYLDGFHIPTHYAGKISETEMLIRRTDIIPLTVKAYNSLNGPLMKRLNAKETIQTDLPIYEHYYNTDTKTNTWVNEYHVYALGIATPEEFKQINRISSKVNVVLRALCDRRNLAISELYLEFGRYKGQILLIDEVSPLNCRFLDMLNGNKTKRDKYSLEQENSETALMELSNRLMSKI